MLHHIIFVAFLFWSAFGFLESSIFLLGEKYIQSDLIHKYHIDLAMSELIIAGVSASLSFVLATSIARYFRHKSSYQRKCFYRWSRYFIRFCVAVIFMYWIFDIHLKFRTGI